MISLKTVLKYIFGQLLFFLKNIISPEKILKSTIKSVVFSETIKTNVLKKLQNKGFNNVINCVDKNDSETVFNYKENVVVSNFKGVPETNAELIIFNNKTASKIDTIKAKPSYIYIPLNGFFLNFFTVIKYVFLRKFFFNSFKFWGNLGVIFENKKKKTPIKARRFIPFQFSRIEFLKTLTQNNIDFVVLRWFDEVLNANNTTEDVDVLINSESLQKFSELLNNSVGILPIDLYSSNGDEAFSYAGLPYYTKELSNKILENKVLYKNDFYVPNNYYYLVSLMYHIVFHKSLSSGLDINKNTKNTIIGKRDYKQITADLLKENNEVIDKINLETLYNFLKSENLIPEYDLILKLKNLKNDTWLNFVINDIRNQYLAQYKFVKGLSVFFLREQSVNETGIKKVIDVVNDYGFKLLEHSKINEKHLEKVHENVRGGKWDIGDFEINAGKPLYYFILFDSFNKPPTGNFKKLYPNLENEKATKLKIGLRHSLNALHKKSMNSIHSSDDFFEAIFYLEQLGFEKHKIEKIIDNCIETNKERTIENYEIVKDLSRHSSRAKVELIKFENNLAIKKTYKLNKLEYLEREVWFLKIMADSGMVPKVLKEEKNYVIMEYINYAIPIFSSKQRMTSKNIIQLRRFFEILYAKEITILDINATNVLLDGKGNIKCIDFEYAQKYSELPNKIIEIYELGCIPLNKVTTYPKGHEHIKNAYNLFWKHHIYLTKKQFFSVENSQLITVLTTFNKVFFDFNFILKKNYKRVYKLSKKELNKAFS